MNYQTYTIGAEQEFKNIKMTVCYCTTNYSYIVGFITDKEGNGVLNVTIDNITRIDQKKNTIEGMLEISTVPWNQIMI